MKKLLKSLFRLSALVAIVPLIFIFKITPKTLKPSVFRSFSQILSLFPGISGSYLRLAFFRVSMTDCKATGIIHFLSLFSHFNTNIGDRVYIGPQCNIGQCAIGDDTLIASGVHILSGKNQHNFNELDIPIQQQGGEYQKISIGHDCWVGNAALIMANIGDQAIVAAGSVVIHDVPEKAIVAGNPAKIIRYRG